MAVDNINKFKANEIFSIDKYVAADLVLANHNYPDKSSSFDGHLAPAAVQSDSRVSCQFRKF